jgi:hypothetical protein
MASIAQEYSLFEIDCELDTLLEKIEKEIENRGEASSARNGNELPDSKSCRPFQGLQQSYKVLIELQQRV